MTFVSWIRPSRKRRGSENGRGSARGLQPVQASRPPEGRTLEGWRETASPKQTKTRTTGYAWECGSQMIFLFTLSIMEVIYCCVIAGLVTVVLQVESNPAILEKGGAACPGEGNGVKVEKGKESPSKEVPESKKVSVSFCRCILLLHQLNARTQKPKTDRSSK